MQNEGSVFEVLRSGVDYTLLRRSGPGQECLLAVTPTEEQPPARNVERLVHEFDLAGELDSAWAATPVEMTRHEGRPMLLLKHGDSATLDQVLQAAPGHRLDLATFLDVSCALAAAVRHTHEIGLIHKDLQPANVLLNRQGEVHLTGFGMASRSPRERHPPGPPEIIAGTLPYMAPEQTGRMNRSIDWRADLYSLGVILYEMLSGSLPFAAAEPMEWIHCHIARRPPPPSQRREGVPAALDAIILKLLAKNAEDRYQTAKAVEVDPRRCLEDWAERREIGDLRPGQHDIPDRLLIPEKLYGRDREIAQLLSAMQRVVTTGATELVLISGYSGIGKSSLVNELHKALVPSRGLFAAGKFDQYKRDIPHATLAQAFQGLVRPLLSKNDAELAAWREQLLRALGPNGQLMVQLVPELALIVGEQPPLPRIDLNDAATRLHLVFRNLLGVFARPEHPLVLFIDDLQWLDAGTLDTLHRLVTDASIRHLMVIGAYRDNEVGADHPLWETLRAIREKRGDSVVELTLAPLTRAHVAQLCADALRSDVQRVASLAALVAEKTGGNPFFSIQFITELAEEGLLAFDSKASVWKWDVARIRAKGITDNVAHLMEARLRRLPAPTREVLGELACLGNPADVRSLAMVRGVPETAASAALREAVEAGLILPANTSFSFIHDRVHEAAYALIPSTERAHAHLRIGRVLLELTPRAQLEDRIFEIVSQFERGAAAMDDPAERILVAELNLIAARRAKMSSAYDSAKAYASAARGLLGDDSWERHYKLTFELELHVAECEIVLGELTTAEQRLLVLSRQAADLTDEASAVCLTVLLCFTTGRYERAVDVALGFLSLVGIDWPPHPSEEQVRAEYEEMRRKLSLRAGEPLVDLPAMSDRACIATMAVLTELFPAAYGCDRYLMELVLLRMTNLSLEHGNCESSSVAYSALNMALGSHFSDYGTAYSLGQLACELVERRGMDRYKARVYCLFAAFAMPWIQPVSSCLGLLRESLRAANSVGDAGFAAYNARNLLTHLLVSGQPLDQVQREIEEIFNFVKGVEVGMATERFITHLELVRNLRGLPADHQSADDEWARQDVERYPSLAMMLCYYWVFRLEERFFAGDFHGALEAAAQVGHRRWAMRSSLEEAEYDFYAALARAASADGAAPDQFEEHLRALSEHHQRIAFWALNCPANFASREALVGAELARLQGRILDAQSLYEKALRLARQHGFVQCEAIANELAAQCYAALGLETVADAYRLGARNCYERWGAVAKVRKLDVRHPHLRARSMPGSLAATINKPVAQLDVETVDKASQTLSSEMMLPSLLVKLMRMAVEHAGAQRGVLILVREAEPFVEAEANTGVGTVDVAIRNVRASATDLPESVLQYVLRTRERVVLDDASVDGLDPGDPYVRNVRPRSILCLPIFRHEEPVGVLYLENNLATCAFTQDRVAVLDFLASQAAIALENARLYSDLRRSEAWLTEAQHLSLTGSFYWRVTGDKVELSAQTFRIFELDPQMPATLGTLASCCHAEDASLFGDMIERARGSGTDLDFHYRAQMRDDSVKHLHLVAHATNGPDGQLAYIGAIQDVSESRRAEEALEKARSELAHVTRVTSLGALTASIAHEVNQPLTGIITNASACLRMLAPTPPNLDGARETVRRVIRDGHRAADVIQRLRALFSKEGSMSEAVDLNTATREVIALSRTELQQARVTLRTEFLEDLPAVTGDRVQLQQVILNLLLNACEAMSAVAGRPRQLTIRTSIGSDDLATLSVQDTGLGIDACHSDKLFEAFYSTKKDGMGMGLSVSRSIIESHGGRLWARPNEGPGATFAFSIPAARVESASPGRRSGDSHSLAA